MNGEREDIVGDLFAEIRAEDIRYDEYAKRFKAFSDFLFDLEFTRGVQGITQTEMARRMNTTQSAVSRFESMKNPPTYDMLRKASEAVGGELFLSPVGAFCLTLSPDLRGIAEEAALKRSITVRELLESYVSEGINRDSMRIVRAGTLTVSFTKNMDIDNTSLRYSGTELEQCGSLEGQLAG